MVRARSLGQVDDGLDHRLKLPVPESNGSEHDVLGKLFGLGFDHQHALGSTRDDQIELREGNLGKLRVQDIVAVDVTDPRPPDRPQERYS